MLYSWEIKVFGENGGDFSDKLVAPVFIEERLNDELDTGEIVLENMPIGTKYAFPPKTKIRLTKKDAQANIIETYDMLVDHDDVQEYPQCEEVCTHRISVIETSAIAQGMHVDNIALTYELQDVTLNYKTLSKIGGNTEIKSVGAAPSNVEYQKDNFFDWYAQASMSSKEIFFKQCYKFDWVDTESLASLNKNVAQETEFSFVVPKLRCSVYTDNGWVAGIDTSTAIYITREKFVGDNTTPSETERVTHYWNPSDFIVKDENVKGTFFIEQNGRVGQVILPKRKYTSQSPNPAQVFGNGNGALGLAYPFPPQTNRTGNYGGLYPTQLAIDSDLWVNGKSLCVLGSGQSNDKITVITPSISESEIAERVRYKYTIKVVPNLANRLYTKRITTAIGYINDREGTNYVDISSQHELSEPLGLSTEIICNDVDIQDVTLFEKSDSKYNAYDFLRKALLTTETKVLENLSLNDIKYIIEPNDEWKSKLKQTTINETSMQGKNLWEVLLHIGKYMHAIPYLEFAEDEENFVLKFKQLGNNEKKQDNSTKITVFNSRNLSEYFSQYDAYTSNMFSPQNEVEETVVVRSTDSSYLVSNDNAVIVLSKPIMELISVKMIYNGDIYDITNSIFEQSIYNLLSVKAPSLISPCKGDTLFYAYNSNVIQGLNYQRPTQNNDTPTSFKELVKKKIPSIDVAKIKYNDFVFRVRYKTQDSLRLNMFRPDIVNYVKNSSVERYPHNEQFFGQQEKIMDSERFSLNLYGELIRVGNNVYQRQEYAPIGSEKTAGDLIEIDNQPYYVTETQNEYYPDCVLQKVTYSKDFNQLSQIVTIPSEPRFYEIATQSLITREISMYDFFEIREEKGTIEESAPVFLGGNQGWSNLLAKLIIGNIVETESEKFVLPTYAYTKFLSEKSKFPFVYSEENNDTTNQIVEENVSASCIVPVLRYPIKNGIVFEWDMRDNFSAGDYVTESVGSNAQDNAYFTLNAVRYVDKQGRADYFKFMLFSPESEISRDSARALPLGGLFENNFTKNFAGIERASTDSAEKRIALNKDNREILAFNYQINMLYANNSGFVTYPNLFGDKETLKEIDSDVLSLKVYALSKELEPLNSTVTLSLPDTNIGEIESTAQITTDSLKFNFSDNFSESERAEIQSVLVCIAINDSALYPLIGRNVANLSNEKKLKPWEIIPVYNKI